MQLIIYCFKKCHFLSEIFFIKGNQRGAGWKTTKVRLYLYIFILFLVFFSVALQTTSVVFCLWGTSSSFERFEFAWYLPPFNGFL